MVFDLPKLSFELTNPRIVSATSAVSDDKKSGSKEIVAKPSFHQDCHCEGGPPTVATQLKFQMGGRAEPRHDNQKLVGFPPKARLWSMLSP
jgi:hypothetical protein